MRRLEADWLDMARRPSILRRARQWALGIDFSDLDELLRLTGFRPRPTGDLPVGPVPDHASTEDACEHVAAQNVVAEHDAAEHDAGDLVLGRLLVVARTDELAARVVLQRLLPGLCAAARRWSGDRRGGSDDSFDEIVSAAWLVIRAFPVERRPGHLAAKLLRDAEHQAFVKATRRRWTSESTEPATFERQVAAEARPEPLMELAEAVELARAQLTAGDLRLIGLLASGRSIPEVAASLSVSVRTVGYRREALVHRMRSAIAS